MQGFLRFLVIWDVGILLKYGENKAKRAKSCILGRLKALQDKGFSEIWSYRRFLRLVKVIYHIFKIGV